MSTAPRVIHAEVETLASQARAGDAQARERLIDLALKYALQLAGEHHQRTGFDLDECVSAAGLAAVESVDRYDPRRGELLPFVRCRMQSLLGQAGRDLARAPKTTAGAFDFDSLVDDSDEGRERVAALRAAVEQLEGDERKAVEAKLYEGLTVPQIRKRLGLDSKSMHQLWTSARRSLRRLVRSQLDDV